MLTNPVYKNYCRQIAALFCQSEVNPEVCKASVAQRMINELTDYAFENSFLPNLGSGRHYILEITKMFNAPSGESKTVMEYKVTDVITGLTAATWEDTAGRMPVYSKIPGMLGEDGFTVVSANKLFSQLDYKDKRIVYKANVPGYGILFVAQTGGTEPGGGVTPGGTIVKQQSIPTKEQEVLNQPVKPAGLFAGMDMTTLLIIAGVGVAAFLYMKK